MSGINGISTVFLAADGEKYSRLFGLDAQLLMDACITAVAVFVLFLFLSCELLSAENEGWKKRQDKIKEEMETAKNDMAEASRMKAEYDAKLAAADKDVDAILSEGRKKALARENEIVAEAKEEAARVMERAEREIELEKSKVRDEVKQEMIGVAREMAGRFVAASLDEAAQAKLIDEALNEMGEDTWQS